MGGLPCILCMLMLTGVVVAQSRYEGESYKERYGSSSSSSSRSRSHDRTGSRTRSRYDDDQYRSHDRHDADRYNPNRTPDSGGRYDNRPNYRYDNRHDDRYDNRYDDRYGNRHNDRYDNHYEDRYDNRYDDHRNREPCPLTLGMFDIRMDRCMAGLNRLSEYSSMATRCREYKRAEPCVDSVLECRSTHPRIDYYKSARLGKWRDMEREAEIYGVCVGYK